MNKIFFQQYEKYWFIWTRCMISNLIFSLKVFTNLHNNMTFKSLQYSDFGHRYGNIVANN